MIPKKDKACLGIDPGWKNLGMAGVKEVDGKIQLFYSATFNATKSSTPEEFIDLLPFVDNHPMDDIQVTELTMERYVAYQGVSTSESENILMLIGGIRQNCFSADIKVNLVRAIDWKTKLVKLLVKHKGFDNPSNSLDKKFSIAAAHACLDVPATFKTDHEADAICLAALPLLERRYAKA